MATSSGVFPEGPSLKSRRREKEPTVCLPAICGWVTEGCDTADLIDAEALLNELAVASGSDRVRYHACVASLKGQSQQPARGQADVLASVVLLQSFVRPAGRSAGIRGRQMRRQS